MIGHGLATSSSWLRQLGDGHGDPSYREPRPEVRSTGAPAIGRTKKGQLFHPAPPSSLYTPPLIDLP
jgi:hypothetical protein